MKTIKEVTESEILAILRKLKIPYDDRTNYQKRASILHDSGKWTAKPARVNSILEKYAPHLRLSVCLIETDEEE